MRNGERIEGKAGDVILHRPGSRVIHGPLSENEQFINDWIYFSDEGDGTIASLPLPFDTLLHPEDPTLTERLISDIMEESLRRDAYSDRLISDAIYKMLSSLCRLGPTETPETSTLYSQFYDARIRILNRYGDPWTLESMAQLTGYSVSRFSALYTTFFGISPMNDLLNERLEMAKQLLLLRAYKIGDVAELCGFSSIHYFSGFFKRRTGVSPSDYQ